MKKLLLLLIVAFLPQVSNALVIQFTYKNDLKIGVLHKVSFDNSFKQASKVCFNVLYKVYMPEEKALEAIDICANPIKHEYLGSEP
jgi:hypothetical protein